MESVPDGCSLVFVAICGFMSLASYVGYRLEQDCIVMDNYKPGTVS